MSSPAPRSADSADLNGHVVLVGLSGSGKSSTATRLGRRLGRTVLDTDRMVERRTGATVSDVFVADGEAAFRRMEHEALAAALSAPPAVIATGGGVVLDGENRRLLGEAGTVVWLRADPAALATRIHASREARPLLAGDAAAALRRLDDERAPLYAEVADVVVETTGKAPADVLEEVLDVLLAERGTLDESVEGA